MTSKNIREVCVDVTEVEDWLAVVAEAEDDDDVLFRSFFRRVNSSRLKEGRASILASKSKSL